MARPWNIEGFSMLALAEFGRAQRFQRSLCLIGMISSGISRELLASVLENRTRDYDAFCSINGKKAQTLDARAETILRPPLVTDQRGMFWWLLQPETEAPQSFVTINRLRREVSVERPHGRIRAVIADFPNHGKSLDELIQTIHASINDIQDEGVLWFRDGTRRLGG